MVFHFQWKPSNLCKTTLSTESRTVTAIILDDNPSGGQEFVDSVSLWYDVNGSVGISMPMIGEDSLYTAVIPGQDPGSVIQYWVEVTDISGDTYGSTPHSYAIYQPTHPTLVVFNGGEISGYPYAYYFVQGFPHDVWAGEIFSELASAYTTIYEFTHFANGPEFDNKEVIAGWLEEAFGRRCPTLFRYFEREQQRRLCPPRGTGRRHRAPPTPQ